MFYLKTLFINFLIVFFANHVLPGIEVEDHTKLPHLGGDLLFALALGFLNSLIFPILKLIGRQNSILRIAMFSLVLNFAAYAILKLLPIDIKITSVEGYIFGALAVSVGGFITNLLEMKHFQPKSSKTDLEPPEM